MHLTTEPFTGTIVPTKNTTMIAIPNPCSEDFNKMTPTEKGAYCGKCDTDTFDFRKLSNSEVYQIMEDHKGQHICGRFGVEQLKELNSNFAVWKNQSRRTFQSKFLLACLLVFGLGLFSCENEEEAIIENIQVENVIQDMEPQIAHINSGIDIQGIDLLDYIEPEVIEEAPILCELETAGELYYTDVISETAGVIAYDDYVLGGAVVYDPVQLVNPISIETKDSTKSTTLSIQPLVDSRAFEATAFPNPTQNQSTIAIDVEEEGMFDVMMYDMNGSLIRNIHSGELLQGRQQFEVDMYDLNSGIYIVKIISQGQDETLKIQKVN